MNDTKQSRNKYALLDTLKELPSLPQVLVGISRVAEDERSKCDDLAAIILRDQALTMRILRIANSAQYAVYAQRVTTVSKAVLLLGFQSVRAIAMGAEIFRLLSQMTRAGEVLERFWKDAISVAVASQEVAELMGVSTVEEAFVAGLLHDVGKLVFAQCETDKAKYIYTLNISGVSLLEEETRLFGLNHAEVGAELARRWGVPPDIRIAMESHHKNFTHVPPNRGELLAFIVSVAKTLTSPLTLSDELKTRQLSSQMARLLRVPVGTVLTTLKSIPERIQDYAEFFNIQVDDLKVYTLWVEEENSRLTQTVSKKEIDRRELERQQALIASMREIHGLLLNQVGRNSAQKKIAETARTVVGANRVLVVNLDEEEEEVKGVVQSGDVEQGFVTRFKGLVYHQSIIRPALAQGKTVNVIDANVPYFSRLMSKLDKATFDAPCFIVMPVVVNGEVKALFYADRDGDDDPFTDEDIANLESLASLIGLAAMR